MIFKKPYAFFIKYFRLINFVLMLLIIFFVVKLNTIHNVINQIYSGTLSNYSNLGSQYIGFSMYLLIFVIYIIDIAIILLLRNKKKPYKDYLFLTLYNIIIIIYLVSINNLFYTLSESVVEQTEISLYSDISFLVFLPLIYFIFKYFLIAIGFNLKKFDFTKDIIELKAEEEDSEEIELLFDKHTFKYKRRLRKGWREFKYYLLENKFLITIICSVLAAIGISTFIGMNILDDNKISIKESFVSNSISYSVNFVYETKYGLNKNIIKDDSKFVVASISVKNLGSETGTIDFKSIRLFYGKEYVYANNYFNNYFIDLGVPYNNQRLKSGEDKTYLFIFKVPYSYKSKSYSIKFYTGLSYDEEGKLDVVYKTLSINAKNIDKEVDDKTFLIGENSVIDKNKYGNTNITFRNFNLLKNYISEVEGEYKIVKTEDLNKLLLVLDYEMFIDREKVTNDLFLNSNDFFDKFLKVEYNYNGKYKNVSNLEIIKTDIPNKLFVSVPSEVGSSENINLILMFRNSKIIFNIK